MQLLAALGVEPDDLGDRRHLAQQLHVVEAPLLDRIGVGAGLAERGPAELVLDVVDVLLDARRGGMRLLALQGDQVALGLAIGEPDADGAARDEQ